MNAKRRKEIEKACERFNVLDNKIQEHKEELESLKEEFERLRDEEQEYIDNMPEGLKSSDKCDTAESCVSEMDNLITGIDGYIESMDDAPNSDDLLAVL